MYWRRQFRIPGVRVLYTSMVGSCAPILLSFSPTIKFFLFDMLPEVIMNSFEDILACYPMWITDYEWPGKRWSGIVGHENDGHERQQGIRRGLRSICLLEGNGILGLGEYNPTGIPSNVKIEGSDADGSVL